MTTSEIGILIAIIVYMVGVVGIGVYFAKKNSTTNDFYLGGRKLGPLVTAMSAEASDMSSWLLMGLMLQVFVMHSGQLPDLLLEHTLTGLLLPKDLELTVTFAVQSLYLTFLLTDIEILKC